MEFSKSSATVKETAGDQKIDNSKYKAEFHTKAKMLTFNQVEE